MLRDGSSPLYITITGNIAHGNRFRSLHAGGDKEVFFPQNFTFRPEFQVMRLQKGVSVQVGAGRKNSGSPVIQHMLIVNRIELKLLQCGSGISARRIRQSSVLQQFPCFRDLAKSETDQVRTILTDPADPHGNRSRLQIIIGIQKGKISTSRPGHSGVPGAGYPSVFLMNHMYRRVLQRKLIT